MIMNIGEIIKDAVRNPLLDLKKLVILGIIILINSICLDYLTVIGNVVVIIISIVIGLLSSIISNGYLFKILKPSLAVGAELPDFNDFNDMFIDGIKVLIVSIVYLIPAIFLIIIFFNESFTNILGIIITNPPTIIFKVIWGILGGMTILDIQYTIVLLYMIIIIPILYLGITNMANNEGKLSTAFKFHEIINKIRIIGWGNIIIWYFLTGIFLLILLFIGLVIGIFNLKHPIQGLLLLSLIIAPYFYLYLYRAVALFYISE